MLYRQLLRPLLFRFDSETVHHWSGRICVELARLKPLRSLVRSWLAVDDPIELMGLRFPNRVGLAAGFDKNGYFPEAAEALGFGHLEVGAVTPRPQAGHPRPRLFRLIEQEGLRNRMGFNNDGALAVAGRLASQRAKIPVGINLGKQKETPLEQAARDYCAVLEQLFGLADFFVVNVSSPNTEGLRQLQDQLGQLIGSVQASNQKSSQRFGVPARPVLVKLSPDLDEQALVAIAEGLAEAGANGVVATNTTSSRDGALAGIDPLGGISGRPLTERSRQVVGRLRSTLGPGFPIIGVGGVHDGGSAQAMLEAGADLIQVYTGFVYGGPGFAHQIASALKGATE